MRRSFELLYGMCVGGRPSGEEDSGEVSCFYELWNGLFVWQRIYGKQWLRLGVPKCSLNFFQQRSFDLFSQTKKRILEKE